MALVEVGERSKKLKDEKAEPKVLSGGIPKVYREIYSALEEQGAAMMP
jgi:hypothetical protein